MKYFGNRKSRPTKVQRHFGHIFFMHVQKRPLFLLWVKNLMFPLASIALLTTSYLVTKLRQSC